MSKKASTISLTSLLGLIFTAFLIFAVYSAATGFIMEGNPEQDLLDSWVVDINKLDKGRTTQLLSLTSVDANYAFVFFQPNSEVAPEYCDDESCICVYDYVKVKKESCKKIWGLDGFGISSKSVGGDFAIIRHPNTFKSSDAGSHMYLTYQNLFEKALNLKDMRQWDDIFAKLDDSNEIIFSTTKDNTWDVDSDDSSIDWGSTF